MSNNPFKVKIVRNAIVAAHEQTDAATAYAKPEEIKKLLDTILSLVKNQHELHIDWSQRAKNCFCSVAEDRTARKRGRTSIS